MGLVPSPPPTERLPDVFVPRLPISNADAGWFLGSLSAWLDCCNSDRLFHSRRGCRSHWDRISLPWDWHWFRLLGKLCERKGTLEYISSHRHWLFGSCFLFSASRLQSRVCVATTKQRLILSCGCSEFFERFGWLTASITQLKWTCQLCASAECNKRSW